MPGPWERYQTPPEASVAPAVEGPWMRYQTPAPAAAPASIDLRRSYQPFVPTPGITGHRDWWDQNYQRIGLPQYPETLDQIEDARRQFDPEGYQAFENSPEGAAFRAAPTTEKWTPEYQRENLIPVTGTGQFLRMLGQGASFGWSDELAGLLGGDPAVERMLMEGYRQAAPSAARVAETVGALATAAIPAGAAARGASMLARVARGTAAGAAGGALYGAGTADTEDWSERANAALRAAIPASAIGGAIPVAAPAVARALRGIIPEREGATLALPTVEDMQAASRAAYRRADDAGLVVAGPALDDFAAGVRRRAAEMGLDAAPAGGLTPSSARLLDLIDQVASPRGLPPGLLPSFDLRQLSRIREWAGAAAGNYMLPRDQAIALMVRDEFDDWLDALTPNQVLAGNLDEATAALREARTLWSRMRKTEIIEGIENRAEISVGQSVNAAGIEQALRREFGNLAKNPRQMARFSEEEQTAIRAVVDGGRIDGLLRRLAVFAPRGFFSTALGILGATSTNYPLMGLTAAGEIARRSRDALTRNRVGQVNSIVRTGYAPPIPVGTSAVSGVLQAGNIYGTPRALPIPLPPLIRFGSGPLPVR